MDDRMLTQLVALDDQDQAECDAWMRDASTEDKLRVWAAIQRMGGPEKPLAEIVSRFAQLAFSQAMARLMAEDAQS